MRDTSALVISNRKIADDYFELCCEAPEIADSFRAGQFAMVRVRESKSPLLRRPLALFKPTTGEKGRVMFIYRLVGEGTRILSTAAPGSRVGVLGPLGNGFKVENSVKKHILVAGGCGLPPILALAGEVRNQDAVLVYGAKTESALAGREHVDKLGIKSVYATEDGSVGSSGNVVSVVKDIAAPGATVYACGPKGMLEGLGSLIRESGAKWQFSLEERMACGTGSCQGCVVKTRSKNGVEEYKRVCKEGPVFFSDEVEIVWS